MISICSGHELPKNIIHQFLSLRRFIVCPVCGGPVKQVIRILRQTEQSSDEADGNSGD